MSTWRVKDTECRPCRWKVYDSSSPVERNDRFYSDYFEAAKEADRLNKIARDKP